MDIRTAKICMEFSRSGFLCTVALDRKGAGNWTSLLASIPELQTTICSSEFLPRQLIWNPIRSRCLRRLTLREEYDVIYARDMFMGAVAVQLRDSLITRSSGRVEPRLVVDIADDYVEVLRATKSYPKRVYGRLVHPELLERYICTRADSLWFVSPLAANKTLQRQGFHYEPKVSLLPNSPVAPLMCSSPLPLNERPAHVVYAGTVDKGIRDFETVYAADLYMEERVDIDCYTFSPAKNPYVRELQARARSLSNIRVRFQETVAYGEYGKLLGRYRIGIIPHCSNGITNDTVPNKLYDYIDCGLLVLASANPAIALETKRLGHGLLYKPEDPRDLARSMRVALDIARSSNEAMPGRSRAYPTSFYFGEYFSEALSKLIRNS